VTAAGIAAYLTGFWLIAGLGITLPWRLTLAACWCADAGITLSRLRTAACRLALIRVRADGIEVLRQDGMIVDALLLSGSVVTRRLAWLRLVSADGTRHRELIVGRWSDPASWHRLQLLWQLRDPGFGHPGAA
jgi:hypothetical protein